MFTSFVPNFLGFTAMGVILVAMIGVGVAELSGLIGGLIRKLVAISTPASLTFIIVFVGIVSSIAADAGYLVLIPLAATAFLSVGRNPLAGIAAGFGAVSAAFGVNILIVPADAVITDITNEAAGLVDPGTRIDLVANLFFGAGCTIFLTVVIALVTTRLIEPRLGRWDRAPAAPPVQPERDRLTLAETLGDARVMVRRQLRKTLRKPVYIVFAFVQPVMFVLLFRYVFGGAINTPGYDYVDFLMPGIIVQTAVFGALMTGIGLTEDLRRGVIDRFRSLPIARSAVLVGRTAADCCMNVLTLSVMLLVGIAVGFRPSEPVWSVLAGLLLVLAFAYTFSWISAWVGLSVKDPETAQSAGFIWVFP